MDSEYSGIAPTYIDKTYKRLLRKRPDSWSQLINIHTLQRENPGSVFEAIVSRVFSLAQNSGCPICAGDARWWCFLVVERGRDLLNRHDRP